MSQIKAVAAGVGGAVAGGGVGIAMLPDGTPWYGYCVMAVITGILPYLATYFAPKNTP
ncbi:MAG TPA: hypothetical protein VN838_16155 [Bradyrhizobium sp.]|nr:hypothetical protein [Bradyrhizobium sp.]